MPIFSTCTVTSIMSRNRAGLKKSHEADTRGNPNHLPSSLRIDTDSPSDCKRSTSADSMNRKKLEKCTMPAVSVSTNSMRRVVRKGDAIRLLILLGDASKKRLQTLPYILVI